MISIVIETTVISRCLDALKPGMQPGALEMSVALVIGGTAVSEG